jgi:formylglycine-generating enzyme required for sulfatase activity
MKTILAAGFVCVLTMLQVAGQQTAPTKPATGQTNAAVVPTNAPPPVAGKTNKVDIKELMQGEAFTNDTGMVMVKISGELWAGKYEVTQEEYQKISGANPSEFRGDRNPVDSVSYSDALTFCGQLVEAERKAEMLPEGFSYTIPTQGQWEALMDGAALKDAVTSQSASRTGTAAVGSLGPNSLNLHDTRGNLWEWCLDPTDKPFRVLRGGAWDTSLDVNLRPEFRWYSKGPDDRQNNFGFRCILVGGGKPSQ